MIIDTKDLHIFNNNGEQLQIEANDDGVLETVVPVNKTSAGLYASFNLFMFQKVIVDGKETFTKPFTTDSLDTRQFKLELESKTISDGTKWFLFSSTVNSDGVTVLQSFNETNLSIDYQSNANTNTDPITIPESDLNQEAFQIDIGAYSEEDGGFGDKLLIIDPDTGDTFLTIQLYVEFEEEDDRLDELIKSLGIHRDFNTSHWNLLSDSDPEEAKIDWNKLNAKRKELLLEYHNILPYRGTYKGLVNILKFFGYGNLEIKEYWVKPNYIESKLDKKLKTVVSNGSINVQNDKDDRNFNKSGFFALVYKINEVTDELSKLDLPITIESTEFTDRELLLKLFGLKSYLNKRWMVSTTKVIDIRGEGDWFNGVSLSGKSTYTPIFNFNQIINPDFNIEPEFGWIVDLRNLEELLGLTTTGLPDNDIKPATDSNTTIDEISDIIAAYFTDYHPTIDTKEELPDAKDIDVGMPVTIKNTSFSLRVMDMNVQIKSIKDFGDRTWQFELSNIATGDTYELIDTQSGESINYTVQSGDSEQDVITNLQNQAQNLNENPWDWYDWKVDSNSEAPGNNLLIAEQLFTGDLPVRWRTKVDEGNISPGIDIDKWKTEILFTGTRWSIDKLNLFNIDWVSWNIEHVDSNWSFTKSGLAGDVETINISLPYRGFYNVTLEMKDYNGNISRHFEKNAIQAKLQHSKVVGWRKGKSNDDDLQIKDLNQSVNSFNQVSKSILLKEDQGYKSIKDLDIPIKDLRMENTLGYFNQDETDLFKIDRLSNIDSLNYDIKDILIAGATKVENFSNIPVNKTKNLNIEQTLFLGDLAENFTLINIAQGDILQIELSDGRTGIYTLTSSDISTEAYNLNQSNDEVISEFVWNPVENISGNYVQLQGVRKKVLGDRDKSIIANYTNNQFEIKDHFPSIMTNPSWYNLIYLKEPFMNIPLGSFCVFTPNSGPSLGKNLINWKIKNMNRNEIDYNVDSNLFSWFFNEKGFWNLILNFKDSNGNEYDNIIKIKSE